MASRRLLSVTGSDSESFLQGLVTNDLARLDQGLVYAAILTPQGKYLADFFLARQDDAILLDVDNDLADGLVKRLNMYRLRADVAISDSGLHVQRGSGPLPDGAWADPRHPDMGWRRYSTDPESDDGTDWDALRVAHRIPASGVELTPDTYILEVGFERINGVDFRKGCYVGQEVTARMKHKTELRKGLGRVRLDGSATPGDAITAQGKPVGVLGTIAGDRALAYLRYDRVSDDMSAGQARVMADPEA